GGKCGRCAARGEADEAGLALLPQTLECRHDLVEHDLWGKPAVAAVRGDVIVELEQVDAIELQALQARIQRRRNRRADLASLTIGNAHLGADKNVGLELF